MSVIGFLHSGAARKAILANLEKETIETINENTKLPKISENTITEKNTLLKELKNIYNSVSKLNKIY